MSLIEAVGWGWIAPTQGDSPKESTAGTVVLMESRKEALRDKSEISLGELNPLIHSPNLGNIEALSSVAIGKIHEYGGYLPQTIEATLVYNPKNEQIAPRFIARFEVDQLTEQQLQLLEDLVKQTYKAKVRTRVGTDGKDLPTESYQPIHKGQAELSKTGGWYMGPNVAPTDSHHMGLFVFKDLGEVNKDNFLQDTTVKTKYLVEIREAGLYQTDLVEMVTQVGSILGQGKMLDHGELLYEIYYDLMRLGLKDVDGKSIYGMDEALSQIKRGLIIPLANLDLSHAVEQDPESVLLVGVPGTGKTLVVEQLLHQDTGLFIIPIDPYELYKELKLDKEKQTLLPRISAVANSTGRRVVLHIDDIENMTQNEQETHSTLLNLMAGIRASGFYIIASTNEPEKIDPALLQPQRFGVWIYCGLQDEKARYEILNIHAARESRKLGIPLFASDDERDIILNEVVGLTEYFTPRYLGEIATVAKSYLLERVSMNQGRATGLTEGDLQGYSFSPGDWERAFMDVDSKYDKEQTRKRDQELKEFVNKHRQAVGFKNDGVESRRVFSDESRQKIAALKSQSVKPQVSP